VKIYAYDHVDEACLNKEYYYQNDLGEDISFSIKYDPRLIVNMEFAGQGLINTNAQGWRRDQSRYFRSLLENHPDAFSERNRKLIGKRRTPNCDEVYTNYFNDYRGYEGSKLVHHHIGRDGQAIGLPQDLHIGTGGVHIAEKSTGLNKYTEEFSALVQADFENNISYDWDKADEYYKKIASENQVICEQPKESVNECEEKLEVEKSLDGAQKEGINNNNEQTIESKRISSKGQIDKEDVGFKAAFNKEPAKIKNYFNGLKRPMSNINPIIIFSIGLAGVTATVAMIAAKKNPEAVNKIFRGIKETSKVFASHVKGAPEQFKVVVKAVPNNELENIVKSIDVVEMRKSPVAHVVKSHLRNGKSVKGYPRGK